MLTALVTAATLITLLNLTPFSLPQEQVLGSETISLEQRQPDRFVNSVFKYNILLTLAYLNGDPKTDKPIGLNNVEFTLEPGQVFAFHEDVLPEYKDKVVKVTGAHFNGADGFKSDGYLMGDGVCHLASLIYMAAKNAGLEAHAPTAHNFASINQVPKEYGASIYFQPGSPVANARQNIYVVNNKSNPVTFRFTFDGDNLNLSVIEKI
jgi:hypothetical protein